MSEFKILSECGSKVEVEKGYEIEVEPGDFLLIEAGSCAGTPAFHFSHPNVAATVPRLYGFKHYRDNGSKFWTERAGKNYYFVVPRSAVKILLEKGYSYVKAEINGVKVSFSVSGGGGETWTDWLNTKTQIAVNHPVRDLKRLAEVAVRGTEFEPLVLKQLEPREEESWQRLVARVDTGLKEQVVALVETGKAPFVKLVPGYGYAGKSNGVATAVRRRAKWVPVDATTRQRQEIGAVSGLVLDMDGFRVCAKVRHIDWHATAVANGVAV